MRLGLAYGKTGLDLELNDEWNVTVVEPEFVPGLPDPRSALSAALRSPIESPALAQLVKPADRVGILFSDLTRPTPNHLLVPAVLAELAHVPRENITLFNGVGTHRANTDAQLRQMLGDELVEAYRIVQNNCFDRATQEYVGTSTRGHEIWINREVTRCNVKIFTGFIEPHFFAGFSGGGKALMPGMAGLKTILGNHDAGMIRDPKSTWGETWGNPIWEEVREVAHRMGPAFLVNVTLNKDKQITGVFAGDLDKAHAAGCAFVKGKAMVRVSHPFEIVITTNSGYPLDLNLYQAVKGMSAAAQIVCEGGAIVIAAECWDGIPDHGLYGQLLRESNSPRALLERINTPGFLEQDQWEAQIQAQIQLKADVYVRANGLTREQIEQSLLMPCERIEETVAQLLDRYGKNARICVLPEGPQTIPYL